MLILTPAINVLTKLYTSTRKYRLTYNAIKITCSPGRASSSKQAGDESDNSVNTSERSEIRAGTRLV